MKNVVIFGGGTGLSNILSGLKLFPINVSAIISVSDNGSSTGILKKEMNIPAVGDIATVMISMANVPDDLSNLLKYRFGKNTSLDNHPIKNLLLAALYDIKGNLTDAIDIMCKILDIKGSIIPITEDKVDIVGHFPSGKTIVGEKEIASHNEIISDLTYNKRVKVNLKVIEAIKTADLIIFSPGSLYTSILPHLIIKDVKDAINNSKAPKMYICNLFTEPGETENFKVSDHVKVIEKYVKLDVILANNKKLPKEIVKLYENLEQKDEVKLDKKNINNMEIIEDDIYLTKENYIRHDPIKTAYLIFSYLMRLK